MAIAYTWSSQYYSYSAYVYAFSKSTKICSVKFSQSKSTHVYLMQWYEGDKLFWNAFVAISDSHPIIFFLSSLEMTYIVSSGRQPLLTHSL